MPSEVSETEKDKHHTPYNLITRGVSGQNEAKSPRT